MHIITEEYITGKFLHDDLYQSCGVEYNGRYYHETRLSEGTHVSQYIKAF